MSFPFGSGMPHNSQGNQPPYPNQIPFGAGFPAGNGGYPGAGGYPQSSGGGYASQPFGSGLAKPAQNQNQHPPRNGSAPYPGAGYPVQPGAGYPGQPGAGYPSQPSAGYPSQPGAGYPGKPFSAGYPSQPGAGYPNQQQGGGFPVHQQSYPTQQSSRPSQFGTGGHAQFPSGVPAQSAAYPGHSAPYPGHASAAPYQNHSAPYPVRNPLAHQHSPQPSFPIQKGYPTVTAAQNFSSVDDAKALRKAMKGFGTDENGLIAVLCHRSNDQIQQIVRDYKTNFGRDLAEDIKSETSGNFETVLLALLKPRLDYYVEELHNAMAGVGTDEDALVEILCSLNNFEIHAIKTHYVRIYGKDLESELISETSGHFKRLLVSLCAANRDESGHVDHDAAQRDATQLLQAGELRAGTDESVFNQVLCQRNYAQIRAICDAYERVSGHSLIKAIENEFSGDIKDGLTAIVQCTSNKPEFFATRLHKSMAGFGTTDTQLIRVLIMRSEIDLQDIKEAFDVKYNKSLRSWIKGDTSGHYKHALYHLIGERESS